MFHNTKYQCRYSLAQMLFLWSLLLPSLGFVDTIFSSSHDLVYLFGPDFIDDLTNRIAITLGVPGENCHLFIRSAATGLLSGVIVGIAVLLLLLARSPWFTAMALSLILVFPFRDVIVLWPQEPGASTLRTAVVFCKIALVKSTIALFLLGFFFLVRRRLALGADSASMQRSSIKQSILRVSVVIIYVFLCMYGWYSIHDFHMHGGMG